MRRRGRRPYPDILTPREWEVLDLLRQGLTNERIAERLGISPDGAKYHVSEILSKLGVSSRGEAARWRPEAPPRWAALPAVGWLGRSGRLDALPSTLGWAAAVVSGCLLAGALAGLGLIAFLLLRGGGGDGDATATSPTAQPTVVAVLPDLRSPEAVWSPDGEAVVVERADGLYIARAPEFELEKLVDIAAGAWLGRRVAWSPDGTRIAFAGPRVVEDERGTIDTIYVINADGSGMRDVLPGDKAATSTGTAGKRPNVWLDERTVAFDAHRGTGYQVPTAVNVETGEVWDVLPQESGPPLGGGQVVWSADRQWIALESAPILRVVRVATGEAWDLPTHSEAGVYAHFQAWLADSSGLVYVSSGEEGLLKLGYVAERRAVTLAEGEKTWFQPGAVSLVSPDGRFIAVQGISLGDCVSHSETAVSGQCVSFIDAATGERSSSIFFPAGDLVVGSGPYGLLAWVGNDAVAFIGLREKLPWRVLWLIKNPAEPERVVWQEDTPGEGTMGVDPSPDGACAVVTMPTSENLFPETNYWEARVYRMR